MKRATLAILIATTATASAEEVGRDVTSKMRSLIKETTWILRNPLGQDLSKFGVSECSDMVAKAKAAGVTPDRVFNSSDLGDVRFADFPARVCAPYERSVHIVEAIQMLASVKDGKQCLSEMDRLLKFGIGDEEVQVKEIELKLEDAKAQICVPLLRGESPFKDEKEKARAAAAVPYEEAGITGAKLKICVANTTKIRLAGGAAATPRDIRRASLLFVLNNPAKDKYELTRIEFKGDEIAKISEKTFTTPPVADDYR
jgi:hypothetical protein